MSGFAGILYADRHLDEDRFGRLEAAVLNRAGGMQAWRSRSIALIQAKSESSSGPVGSVQAKLTHPLVADARIDNSADMSRRTGIVASSQADLLWQAFDKLGTRCAESFVGDFSIAAWEEHSHRLYCARDHFGARPFYYLAAPDFFAFSTDVRDLLVLGPEFRELDHTRIAQFLERRPPEANRTFYRAIKRLPPAHWLQIENGVVRTERYWSPRSIESQQEMDEREAVERFRKTFFESVACRTGNGPVGSLLSGGLDSSSVTCTARQVLAPDQPLSAFSVIFPGLDPALRAFVDERPYIDAVCELDGIDGHVLEGDRLTPLDGIEELLQIHGQPIDPPNAYLDIAMYRMASEHGARTVLDGLEGDITLSHGVHYLDELAHEGKWRRFMSEAEPLADRLQIDLTRVYRDHGLPALEIAGTGRFFGGLVKLAAVGRPRFAVQAFRQRTFARKSSARPSLLSPSLSELLKDVTVSTDLESPKSEREAHLGYLERTYIPAVLEFTYANSRHFGLDALHPMFDVRLAELAVALPATLKIRDGWTRYILRMAMSGVVPDTVRWRAGKAVLAPNFDLSMSTTERVRVDSLLKGSASQISDFVELEVARNLFDRNQFRELWPVIVLAFFLNKARQVS